MKDHLLLRLIGGGLVLVAALVLAALLTWQLAQDLAIWVLGRQVKADVVDRWVQQLGEQQEGELEFAYYLQYRFTASNGQTITETTTVSMSEWAGGEDDGGQVNAVYFPLYPKHNRLDDSRYVPVLACAYLPSILIVAAVVMAAWQMLGRLVGRRAGQ